MCHNFVYNLTRKCSNQPGSMSSSRHKVKVNDSLGTSDKEKFDHEKNLMKAKSLSVQAWYNINV